MPVSPKQESPRNINCCVRVNFCLISKPRSGPASLQSGASFEQKKPGLEAPCIRKKCMLWSSSGATPT